MCSQDKHCVEPPPGLIDAFRNEIGGISLLEELFILERVVGLGVGHAAVNRESNIRSGKNERLPAGLKPTVKDLFNPFQGSLALLGWDCDLVDTFSVQILDTQHA